MTPTTEVKGEVLVRIVLTIPCAACKARTGEHCRKRGGEAIREGLPVRVHVQRIAPVWVIYKIGYAAGSRDMREQLNRRQHARQPGSSGEAPP